MKKGFTLIELLAVIVILAIISLIATPIVLNIIKSSKEQSILISAENYLKAVNLSIINKEVDGKGKTPDGLYKIEGKSIKLMNSEDNPLILNIDYEGNEFDGILYIENNKVSNVIGFNYENKFNINMSVNDKLTYDSSNIKPLPDSIEQNKLVIIDYEGTVLVEKDLIEGQSYELPNPPQHEGLIFQEWVSPVEIVDNKVTMEDYDILIGPTFTTASGKNEFDITLTEETGLIFTFQNLTEVTEIDWGDGIKNTELTHEYSNYGNYTIKINNNVTIGSEVLNPKESVINIRLATGIKISNKHYIFNKLSNLETITLPKGFYCYYSHFLDSPNKLKGLVIPYSANNTFMDNSSTIKYVVFGKGLTSINGYLDCTGVKIITIPDTVKTIGQYAFYGNSNIEKLVIPASVNTINMRAFGSMENLKKVIFKGSLNKISNMLFNGSRNILLYDMSHFIEVPVLENVNAFTGINKDAKIVVPKELYDEWINAENWNDPNIVNHIVPSDK